MDRRTFLEASILSSFAARKVRAQQDCSGGDCKLPAVKIGPFEEYKAGRLERPAAKIKRPLWFGLPKTEQARLLVTLKCAYGRMSEMDPANPLSLAFQASLHQYYCCTRAAGRPRTGTDTVADIHNTSDFLPWHRAFLFFHERIIQGVTGHKDFRLPVWDWESSDGFRAPWAYDSLRRPHMPCECTPRGEEVARVTERCLRGWLQSDSMDRFMGSAASAPGSDARPGCATGGPHSTVHDSLHGYMEQVPVAAVDPVFYAHHANVDRYWEHWRARYRAEPWFKEKWLPSSAYYFYDGFDKSASPRLVRVTPAELLDVHLLGYYYDPPTVTVGDLMPISARHGEGNRLYFDKDSLRSLTPLLSMDAGPDGQSQALDKTEDHGVVAGALIRVPNPQPGFYYVAIASPNGRTVVPIGSFAAFVERNARATRFCVAPCPRLPVLAGVWNLIQESARFQVMYAVARGEPDDRLRPEGVKWVPAAAPVGFEFLLPI